MVYEDILKYLGQQNFAVTSTSGATVGLNILFNRANGEPLFCILVNHNLNNHLEAAQIQHIHYQLAAQVPERNILFIIATNNVDRDKKLAQISGVQVWLVDSYDRKLFIYENQPDDYFGLKDGLIQAITETPQAKAQLGLRFKNWPYVTIVLIAINVIWFIILVAGGDAGDASYMISKGASYGPYIFENYQFWRLVTNMFMHFSASHLLGNMVYLGIAGYSIERAAGHWKYLALYMLSGFGASVISAAYYYMTGQNTVSAGASGAVYGLIGAAVYLMIKNRGRMRPGMLWLRIGVILIFLFYSNFINSGIDAVAHAAGFVFGILLSFVFLSGKKRNTRRYV